MPYCLGIGSTRVGPGLHPQYTRAWYAWEAVGGPSNSTSRNTAQTSVEHSADEHVRDTSMRTEPNDTKEGSATPTRQLCLNSHGVLKVRTGHESINQSQPCWALPHQAKGSNTEIRSSAHEKDGANLSTLTGT